MKLVCPACGATTSPEAMTNDVTAREAMVKIAQLPWPLPGSMLHYLSLFRPAKSALSWKKALRIVGEIEQLVATGYVSNQGQIDRDCSPQIWAAAMDQMVERQTAIKRPLINHNYLRQVAYGLADEAAKTQESSVGANLSVRPVGVRPNISTNQPQPIKSILQKYIDGDIDEPTFNKLKKGE